LSLHFNSLTTIYLPENRRSISNTCVVGWLWSLSFDQLSQTSSQNQPNVFIIKPADSTTIDHGTDNGSTSHYLRLRCSVIRASDRAGRSRASSSSDSASCHQVLERQQSPVGILSFRAVLRLWQQQQTNSKKPSTTDEETVLWKLHNDSGIRSQNASQRVLAA
jgi:hypothetical protein